MAGDEIASSKEIERKYDVDISAIMPAVQGLSSVLSPKPETLHAVYYDTPSGALAANAITLRLRAGGHDDGWHLKMRKEGERIEHHAHASTNLPTSLLSLVDDLIDETPVAVAIIDTHRTTTQLVDSSGQTVAEVADDRVSTVDLRSGISRSWREWEAELISAEATSSENRETLLWQIEQSLVAAGAVPSAFASKLARATGHTSLR